jgi:hypothetical protein
VMILRMVFSCVESERLLPRAVPVCAAVPISAKTAFMFQTKNC